MHGRADIAGRGRRVLISTIAPDNGGVPVNVRFVIRALRERGYEPVLAHYEPYSVSPNLSVPSFRLLQRRVGYQNRRTLEGCETYAIGAWLPELEFTHYLATAAWKALMESCCAYLTVAGNVLASFPYSQTARPHLAWISSGWHADRKDRVSQFSVTRRMVDLTIISPVVGHLEKWLLKRGSVLAASQYTRTLLNEIAGAPIVKDVLSTPIDTDFFSPASDQRPTKRIGFSGRLTDPRKNLELLLGALHRLIKNDCGIKAILIGDKPDETLQYRIQELGLSESVEFCGNVSTEMLRDKLRTLDVFVIPSHQEGLCIAALEAMACGCPVVSTRCGGPEEFVVDGETGLLVDFDPAEMADAILRILRTLNLRERLGAAAREKVMQDYSLVKASKVFWRAFDTQFASRLAA